MEDGPEKDPDWNQNVEDALWERYFHESEVDDDSDDDKRDDIEHDEEPAAEPPAEVDVDVVDGNAPEDSFVVPTGHPAPSHWDSCLS